MRYVFIADQRRQRSGFYRSGRGVGKVVRAERRRLVYGGGSVGMMGEVARAVIDHGGEATGIIPEFLARRERPRGCVRI